MRAYYAQVFNTKTMEMVEIRTVYNKNNGLYTVTANRMEGCLMKMNRHSKYAMTGWLIPLGMLAALLWLCGAFKHNNAMGYAVLLGCLIALAFAADKRQKQTEKVCRAG